MTLDKLLKKKDQFDYTKNRKTWHVNNQPYLHVKDEIQHTNPPKFINKEQIRIRPFDEKNLNLYGFSKDVTPTINNFQYDKNKKYFKNDIITDSKGMNRAYKDGDFYQHGDTLYVAGTNNFETIKDDIFKVPFWGDLKTSERYKKVQEHLKSNPDIKRLIGHSLGGSIVLELQKQNPDKYTTRTYGAPVVNLLPNEKTERYRNALDPIAIFDNNANTSIKTNPFNSKSLTHGFDNLSDNFNSTKTNELHVAPQEKDENSLILTE